MLSDDLDLGTQDSVLGLDLVAQDSVLVLDSEGVDSTTTLWILYFVAWLPTLPDSAEDFLIFRENKLNPGTQIWQPSWFWKFFVH